MDRRKILFIALFIVFAIGAAIAIYFVFFRPAFSPSSNTNSGNTNSGNLPSTNVDVNRPQDLTNTGIPVTNTSGVIGTNINGTTSAEATPVARVSSDSVLSARLNPASDKIAYYDPETDLFYEINQDGTGKRQLSSQLFPDAQAVTFSDSGSKAVIEFPDNAKVVYDFNASQQYSLPREAEDFSFSADGNQLAYKYLPASVEDRWLVAGNIDGSGLKFIEAIGDKANDVDVNWSPQGDVVATYRKSVSAGSQEVFFIGQDNQNFKSATTEGRGFTGKWSPDGSQMVYSVYNDTSNYNPKLYIMNASGDSIGSGRTDVGLSTWPDKCTFAGSLLYCATPSFLSPGTGLHPELATNTNDRFYEVNLITGSTTLVAQPNGVTATNLSLSADGHTLFFVDSTTGRIESISL